MSERTFNIEDENSLKRCRNYVKTLEYGTYSITISVFKDGPTKAQRGLFEVWVKHLSDMTGYTVPAMRDEIKKELLGSVEASTNDMTQKEFSDFLENVFMWASDIFPECPLGWPQAG